MTVATVSSVEAVTYGELSIEIREPALRLNRIKGLVKDRLETLEGNAISMTYCPVIAQESNLIKEIDEKETDLSHLIQVTVIPNVNGEKFIDDLRKQIFIPLKKHLSGILEDYHQMVQAVNQAQDPSTINTEELWLKIRNFYTNILPTIFPLTVEHCAKLYLPEVEIPVRGVKETNTQPSTSIVAPVVLLEPQIILKKVLDREYIDLKERVAQEFEERKNVGNAESVMDYGSTIGPRYLPQLKEKTRAILKVQNWEAGFQELKEISQFYNQLKGKNIISLDEESEKAMGEALRLAENRHYSDTNIMPRAALLEAFFILKFIYTTDFQDEVRKKALTNLLMTSFYILADQNKNCTRGLIGRTFQIHALAYNYIIDNY